MSMRNGLGLFCVLSSLFVCGQADAAWKNSGERDEMTGESRCYAHSGSIGPTEEMGFPYGDVKAWLGVGSDGSKEWAYVGFSDSPNLVDVGVGDGFNVIKTRIKYDDRVEEITLTQDWGSTFLHFTDGDEVMTELAEASTVLLELNWYSQGKVYFRFSLDGSPAAIEKMRKDCAGDQ